MSTTGGAPALDRIEMLPESSAFATGSTRDEPNASFGLDDRDDLPISSLNPHSRTWNSFSYPHYSPPESSRTLNDEKPPPNDKNDETSHLFDTSSTTQSQPPSRGNKNQRAPSRKHACPIPSCQARRPPRQFSNINDLGRHQKSVHSDLTFDGVGGWKHRESEPTRYDFFGDPLRPGQRYESMRPFAFGFPQYDDWDLHSPAAEELFDSTRDYQVKNPVNDSDLEGPRAMQHKSEQRSKRPADEVVDKVADEREPVKSGLKRRLRGWNGGVGKRESKRRKKSAQ